ncbi:MAG: LytTR family DNA-binding domain-containing protein, partial [Bacteroidota bacterium]
IFLIDDEPESLQYISKLIETSCPDMFVKHMFTDPLQGMLAIQKDQPDILLIDIEMPIITGLELVRRLHPIDFVVIFVTAFNEYAINAIKLSALDYILKPVDPDELTEALNKASKVVKTKKSSRQYEILDALINKDTSIRRSQENNIALPVTDGYTYVPMANILRVEADHQYCDFYLEGGSKLKVSKNIGHFESGLNQFGFMRVHRSHIINLCKVKRYSRHDGGYVELRNNAKIEISNQRSKKEELLERLNAL